MAKQSNSKRGFAAMDKDMQRKIASKGGRASHTSRGRSRASDSSRLESGGSM